MFTVGRPGTGQRSASVGELLDRCHLMVDTRQVCSTDSDGNGVEPGASD